MKLAPPGLPPERPKCCVIVGSLRLVLENTDVRCIAISGTDGNVPGPAFMETHQLIRAVGQNCGNLMFQYGAKRLIAEKTVVIGKDIPHHVGQIRKETRALVIPSANFLREGFDMTGFVQFIESLDLPLVFLGLGAQAETFDKTSFDFHPSIDRLIALIKERSKAVSVRGEFTARVLDSYGVQNVVITGCPSHFINQAPDFAERIAAKAAEPMRSFITHAEEPWPKSKRKAEADRKLTDWTLKGRGVMVQQSVPAMIEYLRERNPFAVSKSGEHFEASLHKVMMPDEDIEVFRDFVTTKLRTYVSADQWMEDSAKVDFSIGLRLHGNMAAWQAGTPSMWIYHDARTQELAETMGLPRIALDDFLVNCNTIEDARARFEFDATLYGAHRDRLRRAMNSVLEAHEIKTAA